MQKSIFSAKLIALGQDSVAAIEFAAAILLGKQAGKPHLMPFHMMAVKCICIGPTVTNITLKHQNICQPE